MNRSAFSLIELMIVVAIIGFLAMISIPSFTKFLAKAKRSEAYMNLSSLYAAQRVYWAEHGTYSLNLSGPNSIGWKPEGYTTGGKSEKFNYTYGTASGSEGINYFTGKLEAPASLLSAGRADKESFIMVAAADICGNGKPDIVTVDENNNIKIVQDGLE